ncbi:glycosyltransferase family 4 protein [Phycisphaera mikurensis]|uniref:Putative glycosyltransferase n=1 Tax=Phycisphaera mikurensis (strain NBRC 102666 / KCTC 22515 / FYK2301M01) TaxID=1142394 RepID=I0IBD3_PHYMF|nr:glycosyltransferase family 4 protein [Phycisphaera mikurensis]MBB6443065.1 glycosyltransferase involved in cell wall biosynthesis [Phycisphaera mikurensis]BAM02571.1 putative glycosyltransferase [Phycisphaera mikurensis NBRC 102666]
MRILVLAPHNFYVDRGTPIDVDLLLRALSNRGEEVHAAVYDGGEERVYPGVTVHRPGGPAALREVGPGFSAKKLRADRHHFALGRRLARKLRPDVVHAGEEAVFLAGWLRRRLGLPYVYDMDSSIAQQLVEKKRALRPLSPLFDGLEARAIRGALACAPVCPALADLAVAAGAQHVETLHDVSQLAEPDRPATGWLHGRLGLPASTPLAVYVGNLEAYQGVGLLVEAMATPTMAAGVAGDAVAVVVGGGGEPGARATLEARAAALGVGGRVRFAGPHPADRLDEVLAEATVLVAPRTRGINTPQKVFPYLHSGKAVLVTDLPTHSQRLGPSFCRLAAPEPVAFGAALAGLLGDPDTRARLGAAGRAFVLAEHTFKAHQRRVDRLYDRVAAALGLEPPARRVPAPDPAPDPAEAPSRTAA